jgi:hypothetical protein
MEKELHDIGREFSLCTEEREYVEAIIAVLLHVSWVEENPAATRLS